MAKLIYRNEKVNTASECSGREAEANRTEKDIGRFENSDIDWDLTKHNVDLVRTDGWVDAVKAKCKELGCPVKKDSVLIIDHLVTASPEWMKEQKPETALEFFHDALDWIVDEFCGGDRSLLLNARIHVDEPSNWHMCVATIPIVKNEQRSEEELAKMKRKPRQKEYSLNAKKLMGGPAQYGARQQSIEDRVGKKYGLEAREVREPGQAKKHRSVQQAKLDGVKAEVEQAEQQRDAALEDAQKATEARQKAENDLGGVEQQIRAKTAELGVIEARTASELHKQEKALIKDVRDLPARDMLGRPKTRTYPGGKYYDIAQGDYDRVERRVEGFGEGIQEVKNANFAGQEAVDKLNDLLANEEEYIRQKAFALARDLLEQDRMRITENEKKKQALDAREKGLDDRENDITAREDALDTSERQLKRLVEERCMEVLAQAGIDDICIDNRFLQFLQENYSSIMNRAENEFEQLQNIKRMKVKEVIKKQEWDGREQ